MSELRRDLLLYDFILSLIHNVPYAHLSYHGRHIPTMPDALVYVQQIHRDMIQDT